MGPLTPPPPGRTVEELGWFTVDSPGAGGVAKRAALEAATQIGLDPARTAELAIALAEITSNLYRHAEDGRLSVRCVRDQGRGGIEVIAVDSGPGMVDAVASGRDGHSTAGSLGIGLGAIARLASHHDQYSRAGSGTVLTAQFWPAGWVPAPARAEGLTRPLTGEKTCGDRFAVRVHGDVLLLLVADGLGHGPLAAAASAAAVDAFLTTGRDSPAAIVEHLHRSISHTRGAAASVARIEGGTVAFAGLGNVAGSVVQPDGQRQSMVCMPGVVGHHKRPIREFSYPLGAEAMVVMHSDGVSDRWRLGDYPGLARRRPLTIAATLLRDSGQRRDDACVAVARAAT